MKPDGSRFDAPLLSTSAKRHISVDGDDPDRDYKKLCRQPLEWPYSNGTTTASSCIHPSGSAQDGILHYGSLNTLQQGTLDIFSPGLSKPQDSFDVLLRPNLCGVVPVGGNALVNSHWVVPFQSGELETDSPDFEIHSGMIIEETRRENRNPIGFDHSIGTYDSHIEPVLNNTGQQEVVPAVEPISLPVKKEYVRDVLDLTAPVDNYARTDFRPSVDSETPMKCQIMEGDEIPQKAPFSTTISGQGQSASAIALESVSQAVNNGGVHSEPDGDCKVSGPQCAQKDSLTVPCDVCFGVVMAKAMSSFTSSQGSKIVPVNIRPFGDILKLHLQDSNKYVGLLTLPVFSMLLSKFSVRFTATLVASQSPPYQASSREKVKNSVPTQDYSVRIIVYGLKGDKSAVGNLLSDAGLYLQQPSAAECGREVEYYNPHHLLRPGSQMPKLDELSISSDVRNIPTSETLDEVNKNRFMQVFESANDITISAQIIPSPRLRSTLQGHQLTALAMMVEKECGIVEKPKFPSLWESTSNPRTTKKYRHKITGLSGASPIPVYGGILADDMGLGKTLSLLALICSSLDMLNHQKSPSHGGISRATLVVTPKSTIPGWQQQINRHIRPGQMRVAVYHGSSRRCISSRLKNNDIILTTYETLRSEWMVNGALYSEKWYRLVLDEAHHIRNRSSQTFKAVCAIASQYRWCLTGTPIHNSLDDYGALLSFVGVQPFTEKSMFDFWIASPVKDGKPDSLRGLQDLVRATCLRRTKRTIGESLELPPRVEKIETVEFHQADQELYTFFKEKTAKIAAGVSPCTPGTYKFEQLKENNILSLINLLRLICNHGKQLLPPSALEAWKAQDGTSIDWQMMRNCIRRCDICEADIEGTDFPASSSPNLRCQHSICATCAFQSEDSTARGEMECPMCVAAPDIGADSSLPNPTTTSIPPSAKIEAVLRNLHSEQILESHWNPTRPIKSVIFSYWTKMLDLIQQALESHGFSFQRIDGKTCLEERSKAICQFNEDPKCTIMLASIGSAGEGVDLTVANRVHLIEPHWNPMAEAQAVDRVHRIGQTREVVVTRYIMRNSIETYIQWIQQDKLRLINQSLDSTEMSQPDVDNERRMKLQLSLI